jgi:hypothetical protein
MEISNCVRIKAHQMGRYRVDSDAIRADHGNSPVDAIS